MLTPERLLRVMIELIFVLLGGLVAWLALRGHIFVDRHGRMWLILSVVLIVWGLRVLYKPGQWWARWENWTRGLCLGRTDAGCRRCSSRAAGDRRLDAASPATVN